MNLTSSTGWTRAKAILRTSRKTTTSRTTKTKTRTTRAPALSPRECRTSKGMPRRLNAAPPQRTGRVRIDGSAPARVVGYTSYPHRTLRRGDSTVPEVKIAAEARTEFGKGAARRSRREGKVPAVLYGHGTDTRHLSLPGHALMLALKTPNVLLRLEGLQRGGDLALPKSVQRDPVRGFLEHVDLILVRSGEKVTIEVPLRITGEIAPGDGMLNQQLVQIPVEAETLVLHVIAQQGGEPEEEEAVEGAPEAPEALAESDAGDRPGNRQGD